MKKLALAFSLFSSLLFFNSCANESEYHYTAIHYPRVKSVLYADQTLDSISFVTFDTWMLKTNDEWIHIPENKLYGEVPVGYYIRTSVPVTFDPNTTGESRMTVLNLLAHGNVLSTSYEQLAYLNVIHPFRKDGAFLLEDSAFVETDSLVFYAHGPWKVELVGEQLDWLVWQEGTPSTGQKGRQKLVFGMQKNQAENERKAVLRLTSNGVTDDITVVQLPPKKED